MRRRRVAGLIATFVLAPVLWAQDANNPPVRPPTPQPPPVPVQPEPQPQTPPPAENQPASELPAAAELIEQSRSGYGAPEVLAALKTVSIKATLPLPTGENYFDIQSARISAFRFEQRSQEQPGVAVYFDGKIGWIQHSDMRYELIDDFTLERGRHQFNAMFPIWIVLFPEEHFKSFDTVEKSTFNEHECFKVRLNDDNTSKVQRFAHFDVVEKIMRGLSVTQEMPEGQISVQFRFDEWKQIDDVKMFTRVSIDQPNQPMIVTYSTVEFNKVDENLFEQPVEVKELVLQRATPPPPAPDSDDAFIEPDLRDDQPE